MTTDTQLEKVTKIIDATPPNLWKVLVLNDDQTPMDFVIELLIAIFRHDEMSAEALTIEIHNTGSAVAGLYTFAIAEQKAIDATNASRNSGFPLSFQIEEDK